MIISTHTITGEYCEGTLVIDVLETDRGGTTFSTVSAVEEILGFWPIFYTFLSLHMRWVSGSKACEGSDSYRTRSRDEEPEHKDQILYGELSVRV